MQLYSTNDPTLRTDFKTAIFKGLPDDNGLYMPVDIPALPQSFLENLPNFSFQDIAKTISRHLLHDSIDPTDINAIIEQALYFPAPVVSIDPDTYALELFHGPSLAFKDFGARFMAATMSHFNQKENQNLVILVATSGDTGGAVAAGFFQIPGIEVVILYPSGKVSPLQEKQLTTLGHNIAALEINGTFDDCQALVKKAFLDREVTNNIRLSSANSINISRLIPQTFYYFEAYKQVHHLHRPVVFAVPSGNFGNLTAGLFAQRMGLPIHHFIAATNQNDVVPAYLQNGTYTPRPSTRTLSNAMDVGNPSNFARMLDLYSSTWNNMKENITGFAFSDEETAAIMQSVKKDNNYLLDPHGAVGYLAWKAWKEKDDTNSIGIILETAHPAKFLEDVERIIGTKIEIPQRLADLQHQTKTSVPMDNEYQDFKTWLMNNY